MEPLRTDKSAAKNEVLNYLGIKIGYKEKLPHAVKALIDDKILFPQKDVSEIIGGYGSDSQEFFEKNYPHTKRPSLNDTADRDENGSCHVSIFVCETSVCLPFYLSASLIFIRLTVTTPTSCSYTLL